MDHPVSPERLTLELSFWLACAVSFRQETVLVRSDVVMMSSSARLGYTRHYDDGTQQRNVTVVEQRGPYGPTSPFEESSNLTLSHLRHLNRHRDDGS
jgi:hypothetical protein